MSDIEKKCVSALFDYVSKEKYDLEELNTKLYDIPKAFVNMETIDQKELKQLQGSFFKAVYNLLIGRDRGPRLYLFLYAINVDDYKFLLDFSFAKTDEEITAENIPVVIEEPKNNIKFGEPDEVSSIKDIIEFKAFEQLDFRVCKIIKCSEIKKSNNCLKLTIFDGIKERVIVSSIKKYYNESQLVGKKIIVLVNLEPTRITGVTSEGMLIAATNNACGCKVVFVDDLIPEGTKIM